MCTGPTGLPQDTRFTCTTWLLVYLPLGARHTVTGWQQAHVWLGVKSKALKFLFGVLLF